MAYKASADTKRCDLNGTVFWKLDTHNIAVYKLYTPGGLTPIGHNDYRNVSMGKVVLNNIQKVNPKMQQCLAKALGQLTLGSKRLKAIEKVVNNVLVAFNK